MINKNIFGNNLKIILIAKYLLNLYTYRPFLNDFLTTNDMTNISVFFYLLL